MSEMTGAIFDTILRPSSIAIVGASRSKHKVGYQVLANILDSGYSGDVFPVNPNARTILKHPVYPTLAACPQVPDVVVVITPAPLVPVIIESCNDLGVPVAIVISAGFAEVGGKGIGLADALRAQILPGGTRVLGPNCLGCFSSVYNLNATFGPTNPEVGSILLISQSGAMVTGVLDWSKAHGLGMSHGITLGNRMDLGEVEALAFAGADRHTKLVMAYLESFADAPAFFSLASKIAPHKPILLLKGGRTDAGTKASQSHTAALASDAVLVEALAHQAGVLMADDIEHWFRLAQLMSTMPAVHGDDVAVITNAGGPGVVTTDMASVESLDIEPLTKETHEALVSELGLSSVHNPLDLLGDALPEAFQRAYRIVSSDTRADVTLIIVTPQTTTNPKKTAKLLAAEIPKRKKPAAVILIGGEQMRAAYEILSKAQVPVYSFPHEAVSLISDKVAYDVHRARLPEYPARRRHLISERQHAMYSAMLAHDVVSAQDALTILHGYGLKTPPYSVVASVSEVSEAFSRLSTPLAMKSANMALAHKAIAGGVVLGVTRVVQARKTYHDLTALGKEVLMQEMVAADVEVIVGAMRDPVLGPFVTVGLGGATTNVLADRAFAFVPAQRSVLFDAYAQTKAYALIQEKQYDHQPVIQTMEVLGTLLLDFPQIQELEINPLMVQKDQGWVVDIKISVKKDSDSQ